MKKKIFGLLTVMLIAAVFSALAVGQASFASAHAEDGHYENSEHGRYDWDNYEDPWTFGEDILENRKEFETDSVIVTLTRETTRRFNAYTPSSFSEIGCISVEDLTQYTAEYVRNEVRGVSNSRSMMVDTDKFRTILRLELREKSVQQMGTARMVNY